MWAIRKAGLTIGFAAMADTAHLNDIVASGGEEEPVIADPQS